MKLGDISSGDQIDPDRCVGSPAGVILGKPSPNIVGSYTDNRIGSRLIVYGPAKKLDADESLCQILIVPCKGSLHDKLKEVPTPVAAGKAVAGQD
jgi:hypothetical protein